MFEIYHNEDVYLRYVHAVIIIHFAACGVQESFGAVLSIGKD